MAITQKTISFAIENYKSVVADAVVTNLAQTTLYIPETVSSFESVRIDVVMHDVETFTGNATVAEWRVGVQLGAAGYSTYTDTQNIAAYGENFAYCFDKIDLTSYFTTNWSGTSMTFDCQVYADKSSGSTLGFINVSAIIHITYNYDDSTGVNATQIKTVRIPIECKADRITTTTNDEIGTNQIPQLTGGVDPMCPEASVVVRDWFIYYEGDTQEGVGVTDYTLSVNIDSGTAYSFGVMERALQSNRYCRFLYKPSVVPATSSTHQWQVWTDVAGYLASIGFILVVTYEFDAVNTTRINNSIVLGTPYLMHRLQAAQADNDTFDCEFYIQETGTLVLKQSGVILQSTSDSSGAALLDYRAGVQTLFISADFDTVTGGHTGNTIFRIDGGGRNGTAAFTPQRGLNTFKSEIRRTWTGFAVTNLIYIINYISDVPSQGIGQGNRTVFHHYLGQGNITSEERIATGQVSIPDANYYLNDVILDISFYGQYEKNMNVNVQTGSGQRIQSLGVLTITADNEQNLNVTLYSVKDKFKRYPNDPNSDLDIEAALKYILFNKFGTSITGFGMIYTYHSIEYNAADSITGFSGTVELRLHRASDDRLIDKTSRAGDGAFSFVWYDNTEQLYVHANDGVNIGRSEDTLAS